MALNVHQPHGFPFLRAGVGRASTDVLEENYQLDELVTRPVIRDEFHRVYRVFSNWPDFWTWRDTVPLREQCFDEVIFGTHPQHLKFDIDAPGHKIDAISTETIHTFAGTKPSLTTEEITALDNYISELLGDDFIEDSIIDVPETYHTTQIRVRQEKVDGIINSLIDVILDELQGTYFGLDNIAATRDDIIVTESSGSIGSDYKFSFHLIVAPYVVANNEEAKGFTARVLDQLPATIRELVDPQVNKSLQNFRLVGSSKPNSTRVKEVTTRFRTANLPRDETIIQARPGFRVLSQIYTKEAGDGEVLLIDNGARFRTPEVSGEDLRAILEVVAHSGAANAHEFHRAHGELFLFRRKCPSHCVICSRVHDNDNTFMVTIEPIEECGGGPWPDPVSKVAYRIIEHCRRADTGSNGTKTRILGSANLTRIVPFDVAVVNTSQTERRHQSNLTIESRIAAIRSETVNVHLANATELETVENRHIYSNKQMRDYESVPTLAVKGQMKLGKTKAMRDYLNREFPIHPEALRVPVIRMITFRQTFSKSMQREAFHDFELYSDHRGDLDHVRFPRLIVQVESLYRLRMGEAPEPIDLLILDEVESILAQFNSGLHKHLNAAFAMFQWLLATANRVICMDANIGDRTLHVLQWMRPSHPIMFHWNQYRRAADDKYFFTANQTIWLDQLYETLRKGKRIVIPTNSLVEANAFEASIRQRFPEKVIRLYSSRTTPSEKERHFANVHTHWSNLDVLIYTPTVSAGVSYELEHFDVLFGYFTDMSCDVETCRQMLARVRNIGTKEHYICLSGRMNNLPTHIDDIRRLIYNKRTNLYRQIDEVGAQLALQFEYDQNGEIRYHESPYFRLWLETVRIENLSKNSFVARFIDQVADTGASVELLEALPEADGRLVDIKISQKNTKLELATRECEAVAGAPDLTPEEATAVRDRLSCKLDVQESELLGLSKYRLRDTFRWHDRPIDTTFVAAYGRPEVSRIYRNLLRITAGTTIVESLHLIQNQEVANHQLLMGTRLTIGNNAPGGVLGTGAPGADIASVYESRDLHHRYVFSAHYLTIWLLRLCGFRCITDRVLIREETMYFRMRSGEQDFLNQLEQISFEFQIRRPSVRTITSDREKSSYVIKVLSVINPILRKMYGIEVKRTSKRVGGKDFYLNHTKSGRLFAFTGPEGPPISDDASGGPKPHITSHLLPLGGDNDPDDTSARINSFLDERFYSDIALRGEDDALYFLDVGDPLLTQPEHRHCIDNELHSGTQQQLTAQRGDPS